MSAPPLPWNAVPYRPHLQLKVQGFESMDVLYSEVVDARTVDLHVRMHDDAFVVLRTEHPACIYISDGGKEVAVYGTAYFRRFGAKEDEDRFILSSQFRVEGAKEE